MKTSDYDPMKLKIDVYNKVLKRLRESNSMEATHPDFENQLWKHFSRLPPGYALFVLRFDRAEDVVTHMKMVTTVVEDDSIQIVVEATKPEAVMNMHEITFVSSTFPKKKLTSLLGELGLHIQESKAFTYAHGLSINIFVVEGCSHEPHLLKDALKKQLKRRKEILKKSISSKIPRLPNTSNWKPNKESVYDAPIESFRKHLVVPFSERLFQKLYKRAEKNQSFGSKLIDLSSFCQRYKALFMNKLLLNQPCEYTHRRFFDNKNAALSVAKATATLSVAALFGLYFVGTDIIPAMKEKKDVAGKMEDLKKRFSRSLLRVSGEFENKLKALETKWEDERKESAKLRNRVIVLEEHAAKKKASWFGWWSGRK